MGRPERFDAQYYRRYYLDPSTRVYGPRQHSALVRGVVSMIEWFGGDLRDVLDIGAGVGRWGAWMRKHRPRVEVVSTELEDEVCATYGHLQRDIAKWRSRHRFDLIVCQGVLPYLADDDAARAIENIGAMARGFLYLEAVTKHDLAEVCDVERTDLRVHGRTGRWYTQRLEPHFSRVGAGLFYARRGPLQFFELESAR